jgi:hypothetical protein
MYSAYHLLLKLKEKDVHVRIALFYYFLGNVQRLHHFVVIVTAVKCVASVVEMHRKILKRMMTMMILMMMTN